MRIRIDPAGWPFVIGGLVAAIVFGFFLSPILGLVLLGLTTFFLFFFRDPDRPVHAPDSAVLSPADGRVMVAGPSTSQSFPPAQWQQISIFLSPTDVHVNRLPAGGLVKKVEYHPGRFLPAYRADAGDLNEYTEVVLDHGGQTIVVRQIVGILARRIVCNVKAGDRVERGQRVGLIKFGSRVDVLLPAAANLKVKTGSRVRGGSSVLAEIAEPVGQTAVSAAAVVA